jgi:hypothetical protein
MTVIFWSPRNRWRLWRLPQRYLRLPRLCPAGCQYMATTRQHCAAYNQGVPLRVVMTPHNSAPDALISEMPRRSSTRAAAALMLGARAG